MRYDQSWQLACVRDIAAAQRALRASVRAARVRERRVRVSGSMASRDAALCRARLEPPYYAGLTLLICARFSAKNKRCF